jgi:hypothetical protein
VLLVVRSKKKEESAARGAEERTLDFTTYILTKMLIQT